MSDAPPDPPPAPPPHSTILPAEIARFRRVTPIWLIPIVALLVAGWLGYHWLSQTGPEITISFLSADGLTAGQTQVKHKAVSLGTVSSINLSADLSHVVVRVRMRREARPALTDQTRFWIVRPRLTPGSISGLETIVSGSFIELDPGIPSGDERDHFTGLETPPAVRADEPGRSYVLHADRLGALSVGSPIYFRDVPAGEVLGYDIGKPGDPVTVRVFVRAPYADYIHAGTHFWNASGVTVRAGAGGFRVQIQSLQALLTGGIIFDTPLPAMAGAASPDGAEFPLFEDQAAAEAFDFQERIGYLIHVKGSVDGLGVGAPVEIYGIQVGVVSGVQLHLDRATSVVDIQVRIQLEPGRVRGDGPTIPTDDMRRQIERMVAHGLRAQLRSANFITGQKLVALDFFPDAPPAAITTESGEVVLPSAPGGLEDITRSLSDISRKLDTIPFDEIGSGLNRVLAGADRIVNGAALKTSLRELADTLGQLRDLTRKADQGATPALERLPKISAELQATIEHANQVVGSLNAGAGADSAFGRDLHRVLGQLDAAARAVRLLADDLDTHPESLIRGRTGK